MYVPVARQGSPAHILAVYQALTPDQRSAGRAWYAEAYAQAAAIGSQHGYPVTVAAAVIAALSPSVAWRRNLEQAAQVLDAVRRGWTPAQVGLTAYPVCKKRAFAIARTGDVGLLAGPKTSAFFANIAWPDQAGPVTVDRHALRIWLGLSESGAVTCSRRTYYAAVADYIAVAEAVGVLPHEVQAATWLTLARP
jgi:hypothetical protein